MPKSAHVAKENPAPEEKFPADQIEESGPRQANGIRLVIFLHSSVPSPQVVNNRSHEQNTKRCNDQACFPIAKRKAKFPGVFTKKKDNDDQWEDEIKNDSI